jgi:glucose/arabinose dehydrogenase
MIRTLAAALLLTAAGLPALADEPDDLKLPFGFHAQVVDEGVGGGARHIAIHGDHLYISTRAERGAPPNPGIIAMEIGKDHKAQQVQHFSSVNDGTGIRFYKGALYAASPSTVYRFSFKNHELVPSAQPQVIVDGLPKEGHDNVGMAFDNRGDILLAVSGQGNICTDPNVPKGMPPKGLDPCPSLNGRAGVWRFSAEKADQKFPSDGEQLATGVRDMMAVDWSPDIGAMYGVMQDRNGTSQMFGNDVSAEDDRDSIAEEMHRIDRGANLGWPYTYYDIALHQRVLAPEYGGDGKMPPKDGHYSTPVVAFQAHQSPLDLLFYDGKQFPRQYRGGAFVVFQGGSGGVMPQGHHGYDVVFVPFDKKGKPGEPQIFADGFAGPDAIDRNPGKAKYRPSGAAVGPDGSLYVVDTLKGRLWRIYYTGK